MFPHGFIDRTEQCDKGRIPRERIEKMIPDFQKMKCCDDICNLDVEQLKIIFKNLKTVIDHIIQLLNDNKHKE